MKLHIIHENDKIDFMLEKKPRLRHVYLSVDKHRGVVVKAHTRFSQEAAKTLVSEKAVWIKEKLRSIQSSITTSLPGLDQLDHLFIFGKPVPLILHEDITLKRTTLHHLSDAITIRYHPDHPERLYRAIDRFYKELTMRQIEPLLAFWSERMQLTPKDIGFQKFKRRWGCCSHDNKIRFNTLLSQFDDQIVGYIVVHELAHIQEKNHSKKFWDLVARYLPEYKQIHKKMASPHTEV